MKLYLTEILSSKNLTLKQLSKISKIPYTTLWDIEQNNHVPSLQNYVQLCKSLNINPYNELLKEK